MPVRRFPYQYLTHQTQYPYLHEQMYRPSQKVKGVQKEKQLKFDLNDLRSQDGKELVGMVWIDKNLFMEVGQCYYAAKEGKGEMSVIAQDRI